MDLMRHVAKHHCQEVVKDDDDIQDQSETKIQDEHKVEEEITKNDKSFVFSESMLDEFIQ